MKLVIQSVSHSLCEEEKETPFRTHIPLCFFANSCKVKSLLDLLPEPIERPYIWTTRYELSV